PAKCHPSGRATTRRCSWGASAGDRDCGRRALFWRGRRRADSACPAARRCDRGQPTHGSFRRSLGRRPFARRRTAPRHFIARDCRRDSRVARLSLEMLTLLWGHNSEGPLAAVLRELNALGATTSVIDQSNVLDTEVELDISENVRGTIRTRDQVV